MDKVESKDDGEGPIPSSPSMPVPRHLRRQRAESSDDGPPPPSYEEATKAENFDLSEGAEGGRDEASTADDGALSPEEIALVMKMQSERDQYLPERRGSYEEAMEMSYRNSLKIQPGNEEEVDSKKPSLNENDAAAAANVDTVQAFEASPNLHTVESGRAREREEFVCRSCGILNQPITRLGRMVKAQSAARLVLIGLIVLTVIGVGLFVSLFPASFVYIEYYEVALPQSKMTNKIDRETVYYPGCYVLGPDTKLVRFQASAHVINAKMSVFTLDTISITMEYSLVYFLRQKEVGQLYTKFLHNYDDVFKLIIGSSIRNLAATSFTVENFRFNRTYVEREMHSMLRRRLGGDCCPQCCPKGCQSNTYCDTCRTGQCDHGYHIDARYFNLLSVSIPSDVFERYLRSTILEIEKEKEFFLQDYAITQKETSLLTQRVKNEATEIIQNGTFEAHKVAIVSEAEREKTVTTAYTEALQGLFRTLKVARQDYKQSLMLIRALEDSIDNIYAGYGYNTSILFEH